jgi:octanoyl-[GcvH]:protein N-octanoyltransferase
VTSLFGGPLHIVDDTAQPADHPQDYAAWVKHQLAHLRPGDKAMLRFRRPRRTAAFSPQDTTHVDYELVKDLARARGFEPVERGTGGRLTLYDEHALAITILAPHPSPHVGVMQRFHVLADAIVEALSALGLGARVGELPNEYCPGKFSINAEGKVKLVGIAQRMNAHCVQMGAIISVGRSEEACAGIAEAYRTMDLAFDPQTYGAIRDFKPSQSEDEIFAALVGLLSEKLQTWSILPEPV